MKRTLYHLPKLSFLARTVLVGGVLAAASWPALLAAGADPGVTPDTPPHVHLLPPEAPDWRWGPEVAGLTAIVLDEALRSDPQARVSTRGLPALPTQHSLRVGPRGPWTVELGIDGAPDAYALSARVCPPSAVDCTTLSVDGDRDRPWEAPRVLATAVADRIGLAEPVMGPTPRSRYAGILVGRSAATQLGLLPPVAEDASWRSDPVQRAVVVDPGPSEGWSLLLRQALQRADTATATEAAARRVQPGRVDHLADRAEVLRASESLAGAWRLWREVEPASAYGPLRLRTAADLADPDKLAAVQRQLPPGVRRRPEVLAWSAGVWEELLFSPDATDVQRRTAGRELDELLDAWAGVAPHDPTPRRTALWMALRFDDAEAARPRARALLEVSDSDADRTLAWLGGVGGATAPVRRDEVHPARVHERVDTLEADTEAVQHAFDTVAVAHNALTAATERTCDPARRALRADAADHRDRLLALRGALRELEAVHGSDTWALLDRASGGRAQAELADRLEALRARLETQAASSLELVAWLDDRARRCGDRA